MKRRHATTMMVAGLVLVAGTTGALAGPSTGEPVAETVVTGLQGASGSTIGPDGALYVTQGAIGEVSRVDRATGEVTTFASGLPPAVFPIGGAVDVTFLDDTAYVLVTMVTAEFGGADVAGVYRVDGPDDVTVVADLGAWGLDNPPGFPVDFDTGVHYAMDVFRGGLLVTDGHHNRLLAVSTDGAIREFRTFGNIVPTGLDVRGRHVLMAQAGPAPHLADDGVAVSVDPRTGDVAEVADGAPLLVDVERGRGRSLFGLSQGEFVPGTMPGLPPKPGTGMLMLDDGNGTFVEVLGGLDLPTSVEVTGDTAWIVTLTGSVLRVDDVAAPPYGRRDRW